MERPDISNVERWITEDAVKQAKVKEDLRINRRNLLLGAGVALAGFGLARLGLSRRQNTCISENEVSFKEGKIAGGEELADIDGTRSREELDKLNTMEANLVEIHEAKKKCDNINKRTSLRKIAETTVGILFGGGGTAISRIAYDNIQENKVDIKLLDRNIDHLTKIAAEEGQSTTSSQTESHSV